MEDREDDKPGVGDALAFEEEHVRLASKYKNEKVLLEQAIKASTNSSRTSSPKPADDNNDDDEDVNFKSSLQSDDKKKIPELKTYAPLRPIPESSKKSEKKIEFLSKDLAPESTVIIQNTTHVIKSYYLY